MGGAVKGRGPPSSGFFVAWMWLDVLCPGGVASLWSSPPPAEGRRIILTLPTPHLGISVPFLLIGVKWSCGVWDDSVLHSRDVP